MLCIVDYDAGNLTSVKRALDFLGVQCCISPDPAVIRSAERVIFPGVGHARTAMNTLIARTLDSALKDVFAQGTPLMGICLGSQIILEHSEEGDTPCLGLVPGTARRFTLSDATLKIPHMGWNAITIRNNHPLLASVQPGQEFYFVHSYYPDAAQAQNILAVTQYETVFPSVIGYKNLFATQFHPEKSGPAGLAILKNFCSWDGRC